MTRAENIKKVTDTVLTSFAALHNCVFVMLCGRLIQRLAWAKKRRLAHPNENAVRYGKEYCRAAAMKYYWANRETCLATNKAWRETNKAYVLNYAKQYSKNHYPENKHKIIARGIAWTKQRYLTDPSFRMICALRARLRMFVKRKHRDSRTEYLGCTPTHFLSHIENQFRDGMSWDNYGRGPDKWSVDHIKPVSQFDHSDPEQVRACWHFLNLQPLWYSDNCKKNARPTA